jgi:hypothetical protein
MWHEREDGIKVGGDYDFLGLLRHKDTGLYHAAVFEEFGPGKQRCRVVDPTGKSYDDAVELLSGLRDGYLVPNMNVSEVGVPWDGTDKYTFALALCGGVEGN